MTFDDVRDLLEELNGMVIRSRLKKHEKARINGQLFELAVSLEKDGVREPLRTALAERSLRRKTQCDPDYEVKEES